MSDKRQVSVEGPAQIGEGNNLFFNPTTHNSTNSNNSTTNNNGFQFFYIGNVHYHGNATEVTGPHFRLESGQQPPQLQHPSQQQAEMFFQQMQTLTRSQPWNQAPYQNNVGTSQQCPTCQGSGLRSTGPPCSQAVPMFPQSRCDDSAYREGSDNVRIIDTERRVLQPGDGVLIEPTQRTGYFALYVGAKTFVRCDTKTQIVKSEELDLTQPFRRLTLYSKGKCTVLPGTERIGRARSCVGGDSPVTETEAGLDFVSWTLTGMDFIQAENQGFDMFL